jgi:O-antigen ligase
MFRLHPWLGYGFGDAIFAYQYDLLRPQYPIWNLEGPTAPHNLWLEIAFKAGVAGLVAFATFALAFLLQAVRNAKTLAVLPRRDPMRLLATALVAAFVGCYLVEAFFESPNWTTLGLLAGLMQGMTAVAASVREAES